MSDPLLAIGNKPEAIRIRLWLVLFRGAIIREESLSEIGDSFPHELAGHPLKSGAGKKNQQKFVLATAVRSLYKRTG
jgi:hypothetical protein